MGAFWLRVNAEPPVADGRFAWAGDGLFSAGSRPPSIVGAAAFHCRVRDGNGWGHRALITNPSPRYQPSGKAQCGRDVVGGAEGTRTPDLRRAKAALSQLSYGPGSQRPAYRVGARQRAGAFASGPVHACRLLAEGLTARADEGVDRVGEICGFAVFCWGFWLGRGVDGVNFCQLLSMFSHPCQVRGCGEGGMARASALVRGCREW